MNPHSEIVTLKSPDDLLVRELGVRQLAAIIFNNTIGSGIFVLPAIAVSYLGPAAPMAYLVCAVLVGLIVVCFAEAGSRVSGTGGPYIYVATALGPLVGFIAGVLLLVAALGATSAVTTLFAGSVAALFGAASSRSLQALVIVAALGALTFGNVRGVRTGARAIEIVSIAKLIPLVGFVLVGAFFGQPHGWQWTAPPFGTLLRTSGILFFAFGGIETALIPGGEVRHPSQTVPRAAFLALAGVTLLYITIQIVAQAILGDALATDRLTPLATAAARIAGPAGRLVMVIGAVVSMLGLMAGAMLAAPRGLFALARDGFLPRSFAAVHPRFHTPHVALVAFAALTAATALSGTFEQLAVLTNVAALTLYLLCAIAVWVLRTRDVRGDGQPFVAPGGPAVPVLTCAAILLVLQYIATQRELVAVAAAIAVAGMLYAIRRFR